MAGLVSVIGVKTLIFGSVDSTNRAPSTARPIKKENINRRQGALPNAETSDAPATKPVQNGSAPTNAAPTHPSSAAPAGASDAAPSAAPAGETPGNSNQNPIAPGAEQGSKARAPSGEREQEDKALREKEAAPATPLPAPVPRAAPEAATPTKPDKKLNAEPAAVAPQGSREQIAPGQEQNASDSKRRAVNGVDAKPQQQSKDRNVSRHVSQKNDGFSTFLKRTANSVRKFFGRLGEK
ncbi:MAG TPA: hypothetical protein VIF88_06895 [Methylocystis sp.]